jgi:type VI secretion system secreted protein VgrG
MKSFSGPERVSYSLPVMPTSKTTPIKFGLLLQDIPGTRGVAPAGQAWQIVVTDLRATDGITPPQVFDPGHWRETLCSGSISGDGQVHLNDDQQKELNRRVIAQAGLIWFISGLTAMALHPARWSVDDKEVVPEKIVDALNFAADGRGLDNDKRDWLSEHAKADADAPGLMKLKPKTDA